MLCVSLSSLCLTNLGTSSTQPRLQFCLLPSSSCVFRLRSRESNIFVPVGPRPLPNSQPLRCPSRTVPPWSTSLFAPPPLTPRGGKKRCVLDCRVPCGKRGTPTSPFPFPRPFPVVQGARAVSCRGPSCSMPHARSQLRATSDRWTKRSCPRSLDGLEHKSLHGEEEGKEEFFYCFTGLSNDMAQNG